MAWLRHRNRNSAWSISDRNRSIDFRQKWCFTISSFQQKFIKITFFVRNYFWSADTSLRRRNQLQQKKLVAASSDSKLFSQTLPAGTTRRYFGNFWTNRKHNYYYCPVLLHQLKNLRRGLRTSFKMKKCDDSRLFGIRSFSCALTYHLYLPIVCGLFYKRLPKFCPSMIQFCYHCSKMSFC